MNAAPPGVPETDAATTLAALRAGDIVLVDVRETVEYEAEHIPGALLCPLSTFEAEIFPSFPGKRIVIHCAVGKRSAAACKQLKTSGYPNEVLNLAGGLDAWKAAGCPTEVQTEQRTDLPYVAGAAPGQAAPPLADGVHPGRVLAQEFMAPFGLTQSALAHAIGVPTSRINAIVRGHRAITAETALRLARHLCTTAEFWMRLQAAHDLSVAAQHYGAEIRADVRPRRTSPRNAS